MSRKVPPTKKSSKSKHKFNTPAFDWSGVYPTGRIKKQIHTADADIGCLPNKSLQLISACSMLLIRKVVQKSLPKTKENPQVMLLSANDIQKGTTKDKSLGFLKEAIDLGSQTEDNKLAKLKTRTRSNATATGSSKKSKKNVEEALGVNQECLEQALEASKQEGVVGNTDEVVVDDEDYD